MIETVNAPVLPRVPTSGQSRVVSAVQTWIARGELTSGEALPPMRHLAQNALGR